MDTQYHAAIAQGQFENLERRIVNDGWRDVSVVRDGYLIYLTLERRSGRAPARYLCRIDMERYPVQPYRIGFLKPNLPTGERAEASDRDPRYWPYSTFPGLQGSFNIVFQGPYRTFWCRPCTVEYFYYHGDDVWSAAMWPLDRVAASLREAVQHAEHPDQWRPLQVPNLQMIARAQGITLPEGAGLGDA
jgi:hypothetical protein